MIAQASGSLRSGCLGWWGMGSTQEVRHLQKP